jgi:hypothetical protein
MWLATNQTNNSRHSWQVLINYWKSLQVLTTLASHLRIQKNFYSQKKKIFLQKHFKAIKNLLPPDVKKWRIFWWRNFYTLQKLQIYKMKTRKMGEKSIFNETLIKIQRKSKGGARFQVEPRDTRFKTRRFQRQDLNKRCNIFLSRNH